MKKYTVHICWWPKKDMLDCTFHQMHKRLIKSIKRVLRVCVEIIVFWSEEYYKVSLNLYWKKATIMDGIGQSIILSSRYLYWSKIKLTYPSWLFQKLSLRRLLNNPIRRKEERKETSQKEVRTPTKISRPM